MSPRVVGWLVSAVVILVLGLFLKTKYEEYQSLLDYKKNAEAVIEAASKISQSNTRAEVERRRSETAVTERRAQADAEYSQALSEDEVVRHWASTPIPDRLRDIDRKAAGGFGADPGRGRSDVGSSRSSGSDQDPG